MPLKVAYIVMKYPTLSQTFVEREMLALAAHGIDIEVHPCLDFRATASVPAAPSGLRVVRAGSLWRFLLDAGAGVAREFVRRPLLFGNGLALLVRYPARAGEGWFMTLWGALFAFARAAEFRARGLDVIHGAWATAPATAAALLGELCGIPFSFGAHAYDLHRHGGDPLIEPKLARARFVHTTTQANVEHLCARFRGRRADIVLARRGLTSLPSMLPARQKARDADAPIRILSVGRLVEKKGHRHQVEACRELARRELPFHLKIIGDGPLRGKLEAQIASAGLADRIELAGERRSPEVEDAYAWADVFWHTGIVDSEGDRDGLPNVIPEALAHGLPVISSVFGGAAEAVLDGETGLIADPEDPQALADAITLLIADADLRARLGANGRRWVEVNFLAEANTRRLAQAFHAAIEP